MDRGLEGGYCTWVWNMTDSISIVICQIAEVMGSLYGWQSHYKKKDILNCYKTGPYAQKMCASTPQQVRLRPKT